MDAIEAGFDHLISFCERVLSEGALTDLLTKGILSGISGIVVFVPQIAILFTFISLLEESGYMSRVVFLMDNIIWAEWQERSATDFGCCLCDTSGDDCPQYRELERATHHYTRYPFYHLFGTIAGVSYYHQFGNSRG